MLQFYIFCSGVEEKNLILAGFQKEIKEDSMLKFFKPSTEDVFQPKSEINQEEMDMYMAPGMTNSKYMFKIIKIKVLSFATYQIMIILCPRKRLTYI